MHAQAHEDDRCSVATSRIQLHAESPYHWPDYSYADRLSIMLSHRQGVVTMGDAISHAILPGVVLAYLLNFPLVIGAFAAGMCCALTTGYVAENCRVKRDTIMGVVFSGMFALGLFSTQALRPMSISTISFLATCLVLTALTCLQP